MPWLTYQQIGERFGLGTEAARTRVRRAGWRTQPGNDGRTLALVPDDAELRPAGDREPDRDETALTDLLTGALTALEDAVSVLREQLDAANARADAERARADRSDAAVAGERSRSDVLRSRLDEMIEARAEADRAIAEERLRADAAHTAAQAALTRCGVPMKRGRRGACWRVSGPRGGASDGVVAQCCGELGFVLIRAAARGLRPAMQGE